MLSFVRSYSICGETRSGLGQTNEQEEQNRETDLERSDRNMKNQAEMMMRWQSKDAAALGNPDVDDDNPDVNDDVPIAVRKASNVRRVEIWFATKDF